jgi:hypothetical protein
MINEMLHVHSKGRCIQFDKELLTQRVLKSQTNFVANSLYLILK